MTDAPQHGARFEMFRASTTERDATYAIGVHAPEGRYDAVVRIDATSVDARWTPEPPKWIADTMHGFAKTLQKNHVADASWPARLVRWRSERQ